MPSLDQQIANLHAAIAAQDGLRPALGDAIVDATMAALRAQLDALLARQAAGLTSAALPMPLAKPAEGAAGREAPSPQAGPQSPVAAMPAADDPFSRYLPGELAEKIRGAGVVEGERKQVTVVFADLSGFTALSERLDPEDVRALQNDLFPEMAAAVYHYEGYVDKFIGDAIMAVFGAPIAHEDDPDRALRAALDMRARIAQLNRTWQPRFGNALSLHIGINTGTVVAGDISAGRRFSYTVTGDAVNVASRLSDAATPGQILVSRETYRLAQGAFDFSPLDSIVVKGKSEPLAVFEVLRARLYPLKLRGLKELGSAFVARERESALLRDVLADLLAGRGRVVTVTGEAGLGKSRLLAEWRAEVGSHARWREGRAFAHTAGLAYGPFLDFFRRYANIHDDDTEQQARAVLAEVVKRFFGDNLEAQALLANLLAMQLSPAESELLAALPAQSIRARLFETIAHMIEEPTRQLPTILVLEDMHWSDSTSIDLTASLLELTKRVPLAIVVVCRPDLDAPSHRLLDIIESGYADCVAPIALAPLSNASTVRMLEQLLSSHNLPAELTTMICARAEGNPFYVEEVIRMLIERGALMRAAPMGTGDKAEWQTTPLIQSVQVPDTLKGVLMSRLDRLPVEAKWLAQQAAVIGRNFLYRVLVRIGDGSSSVDAELSYLERQELIRERARQPEVEYIFKHALTQDVAYHSLLAPRRKELHQRTGQALEELFAERLGEFSGLIAFHYLRGEAWEKAVAYLLRAGDDALGLYAHSEARQHYAAALTALDHLPDSAENRRRRVDTTVKRVSVSWVADPPEQNLLRLTGVEALAKDLPDPGGGPGGDRLRLARIHYWMGRLHYLRNEPRDAIGYYRQVLAIAQELGDAELLAIPSSVMGQALLVQGNFGAALPLLAQAVGPLEKAANWVEWTRTVGFLGVALAACGQYTEGIAEGERALARAGLLNNQTVVALCHAYFATIHVMGNEWSLALVAGRAIVEIATQSGDKLLVYMGYGFQGWAEGWLGHHAEAVKHLQESKTVGQQLGARLLLADWFAAGGAEAAFNSGRIDDALAQAAEAVSFATAAGTLLGHGLAEHVWARALAAKDLSNWAEIEAHLAASLSVLESGGARLSAARTRVTWGLLCRQRDDLAGARAQWSEAAAQFEASLLSAELAQTRQWLAAVS